MKNKYCKKVKRRLSENWLKKNRKALNDYNKRIEKNGLFSDEIRSF